MDFEGLFSGLGKKLDELINKGTEKGGEMKDEFEGKYGDKFETLKKSRDEIEAKLKDMKESDKLKEVGSQLEKAGQEFKKAIDILFTSEASNATEEAVDITVTDPDEPAKEA